jgi:hypothetical protein
MGLLQSSPGTAQRYLSERQIVCIRLAPLRDGLRWMPTVAGYRVRRYRVLSHRTHGSETSESCDGRPRTMSASPLRLQEQARCRGRHGPDLGNRVPAYNRPARLPLPAGRCRAPWGVGSRVPQPHHPIVTSGGQQGGAIGHLHRSHHPHQTGCAETVSSATTCSYCFKVSLTSRTQRENRPRMCVITRLSSGPVPQAAFITSARHLASSTTQICGHTPDHHRSDLRHD